MYSSLQLVILFCISFTCGHSFTLCTWMFKHVPMITATLKLMLDVISNMNNCLLGVLNLVICFGKYHTCYGQKRGKLKPHLKLLNAITLENKMSSKHCKKSKVEKTYKFRATSFSRFIYINFLLYKLKTSWELKHLLKLVALKCFYSEVAFIYLFRILFFN